MKPLEAVHKSSFAYTQNNDYVHLSTPRPKFLVAALVVSLAINHIGNAQYVKLQPLSEYEASLRAYHTAKVRTQCIEFEASTKKKWWYYIPQLGFNFGLPIINGGTSTFVQLDVQKGMAN